MRQLRIILVLAASTVFSAGLVSCGGGGGGGGPASGPASDPAATPAPAPPAAGLDATWSITRFAATVDASGGKIPLYTADRVGEIEVPAGALSREEEIAGEVALLVGGEGETLVSLVTENDHEFHTPVLVTLPLPDHPAAAAMPVGASLPLATRDASSGELVPEHLLDGTPILAAVLDLEDGRALRFLTDHFSSKDLALEAARRLTGSYIELLSGKTRRAPVSGPPLRNPAHDDYRYSWKSGHATLLGVGLEDYQERRKVATEVIKEMLVQQLRPVEEEDGVVGTALDSLKDLLRANGIVKSVAGNAFEIQEAALAALPAPSSEAEWDEFLRETLGRVPDTPVERGAARWLDQMKALQGLLSTAGKTMKIGGELFDLWSMATLADGMLEDRIHTMDSLMSWYRSRPGADFALVSAWDQAREDLEGTRDHLHVFLLQAVEIVFLGANPGDSLDLGDVAFEFAKKLAEDTVSGALTKAVLGEVVRRAPALLANGVAAAATGILIFAIQDVAGSQDESFEIAKKQGIAATIALEVFPLTKDGSDLDLSKPWPDYPDNPSTARVLSFRLLHQYATWLYFEYGAIRYSPHGIVDSFLLEPLAYGLLDEWLNGGTISELKESYPRIAGRIQREYEEAWARFREIKWQEEHGVPVPELDPPVLDLGTIWLGGPPATADITLTNVGADLLEGRPYLLSGEAWVELYPRDSLSLDYALWPDRSKTWRAYVHMSLEAGDHEAVFRFPNRRFPEKSVDLRIRVRATFDPKSVPVAEVSPGTVDLDADGAGSFTIRNAGGGILSAEIDPPGANWLALSPTGTIGIPQGQETTVTLRQKRMTGSPDTADVRVVAGGKSVETVRVTANATYEPASSWKLLLEDSDSEKPVPNATVTLLKGDTKVGAEDSDADGEVHFDRLTSGTHVAKIVRSGYEAKSVSLTLSPGDAANSRVPLVKKVETASILVTVTDYDSGGAIEGARVLLSQGGKGVGDRKTDASGRARFEKLPFGKTTIGITKSGFNGVSTEVLLDSGDAGDTVPKAVKLTKAKGTLAGKITLSDTGGGATDGRITIKQDGVTIDDPAAKTDGTFSLKLPVGTYTVIASATYYQNVSQTVTVAASQTKTVNFSLSRTVSKGVKVQVVDAESASGIAGAVVKLLDGSGKTVASGTTVSGGTYTFTGIGVGTYTAQVTASGYKAYSKSVHASATKTNFEQLPIHKLGTKGTLKVTVYYRNKKGSPWALLSGAKIRVYKQGTTTELYNGTTDGDGVFTVKMEAGRVDLKASASGYGTQKQTYVWIMANVTSSVKFELE